MNERMPAWALYEAFGVRVAAGCGAERKQAWADCGRQARSAAWRRTMNAEAVTQRVQALNAGHVIHQAKSITVDVEPTAFQARPSRDAGTAPAIARIAHSSIRLRVCRSESRCRGSDQIAAAIQR